MDTTTAARATTYEVPDRLLASYWTIRTAPTSVYILTRWFARCHEHGYDPVSGADAVALEVFIAELKTAGCAPNTIVGRNPVETIHRPSRPTELATAAAESRGGAWWAAAMLLGLNGLGCRELIACRSRTSASTRGITP